MVVLEIDEAARTTLQLTVVGDLEPLLNDRYIPVLYIVALQRLIQCI